MEYEPQTVLLFRIFLIFVAPLAFLLYKTRRNPRAVKLLSKFNGPFSIPVFGCTYRVLAMGGLDGIFKSFCYTHVNDFGRLFRVWQFNYPQVVIANAKDAEKVLHSARHVNKSPNYAYFLSWLGTGLATAKDTIWRAHRKMLTPAFQFSMLHKFLHIFNKNANILSDKLNLFSATGKDIDICEPITLCALDIINESSMGEAMESQMQENSPYLRAVRRMNNCQMQRFFSFILRVPLFYNYSNLKQKTDKSLKLIRDFTESVIAQRRQYLQSIKKDAVEKGEIDDDIGAKRKNVAFIDVILMAGEDERKIYKDADILDEVNTFLVAGQDTVTTAMGWTLFLIGTYPEVQEKVLEELIEVFGDSGREPTMGDLSELKYLERCIKETLRLYPSIPIIEREVQEDVTLDCGRVIPAGCGITFLLYSLHRDPEYFPDPETFDPDRFLPENTIGRHPYAYLPFSAGPRNCIGQKYALLLLKSLLSTVLRRFRVEAAFPRSEARLEIGINSRPKKRLKVRLFERKSHPNLRVTSAEEQANTVS